MINLVPVLAAKKSRKTNAMSHRHKLIPALAVCCVVAVVVATLKHSSGGADRPFEGQTLHIYNWGEYTGENIIGDFEEETGATVVMETLTRMSRCISRWRMEKHTIFSCRVII